MTNHLFARFTRSAAAVAALLIGSAAPALADNIAVNDSIVLTSVGASISGAVFNFDLPGSQPDLVSFCLQRTEFIDVGQTYVVANISNGTDDGTVDPGNPITDPISNETAWIYATYRSALAGGPGFAGSYSINDIQAAIWQLEETLAGLNPADFPNVAALISEATDAVNNGFQNNGLVQVLNLKYLNGTKAQDQLAMVSVTQVPEPGSIMLLGAGLLAVARAGRRRRQLKA